MTPLTHKAAIANIPVLHACREIPRKHVAFASNAGNHLDSWIDAELKVLVERFADFQTVKSVKHSMGR